jgi:hypothetical protein
MAAALSRTIAFAFEDRLVGAANDMDGCAIDAGTGHADDIQATEQARIAVEHAVGNDIVADSRETADEGVATDAGKLMHGRTAAENDAVLDDHVTGQHDVVRHDDMLLPTRQSWATCELARNRLLLPTIVLPPKSAVPVFIVTPSRIVQLSPIVKRRFFAAMMHALRIAADHSHRENLRALADRRDAGHHACAEQFDVVASATLRADMAERADLDVLADHGSVFDDRQRMNASRWRQSCSCLILANDHRADIGFGDERSVNLGIAMEFPDIAALLLLDDMEFDPIARHDRLAEAGIVDGHEIDQVAGFAFLLGADRAGRLGHALDQKNARHDRLIPGKCPVKCGSLAVTFLMPIAESSPSISMILSTSRNG